MKRTLVLPFIAVFLLSGCAASRVQTETGAMSIDQGKFLSNSELVYSSASVGSCSIPSADKLENGNYSIPLTPPETKITCTKNGKEKVVRTVEPVLWKTKYDSSRSSAMASSFIFGGPLALAMVGGMSPSNPELEDVQPMHRIYPPYLAVINDNASAAERNKVKSALNKKFASYYKNLPKDCDDWNQRGFNALCKPEMIELLQEHELAYLSGTEFKMPEKIESQETAAEVKEEEEKGLNE